MKPFIGNCSGDKILLMWTFNHRQLGYTDEWLYRAIAESGAKGDHQANRDFFNVWTMVSKSPLSTELKQTK